MADKVFYSTINSSAVDFDEVGEELSQLDKVI